jgi:transposase
MRQRRQPAARLMREPLSKARGVGKGWRWRGARAAVVDPLSRSFFIWTLQIPEAPMFKKEIKTTTGMFSFVRLRLNRG